MSSFAKNNNNNKQQRSNNKTTKKNNNNNNNNSNTTSTNDAEKKKLARKARKLGKRQLQLQKMAEKAEREDKAFRLELEKFSSISNSNKGYLPSKYNQPVSETQLFEKQGAAGIKFDQYDEIEVKLSGNNAKTFKPLSSFAKDISLPKFLKHNITLMKYERPTPIQSYALPIAFANRDLMCCAQTGSGKTCAFLLPVVLKLSSNGKGKRWNDQFVNYKNNNKNNRFTAAAPSALVLAPTRELAIQIEIECEKLCNGKSNVSSCVVYGGANAKGQLVNLAKGKDILVATPGRLQDFVDRNLVSLEKIQFLILDEADRMLDMGFEPQIRKLVQKSNMPPPKKRQTFMFSATFPNPMQKLAGEFLNDYVWIGVGRVGSTVSSITQKLVLATNNKREKLQLLKQALATARKGARTLIFVKKKSSARWVSKQLRKVDGDFGNDGITSAEIHGDRSQSQREAALNSFRNGQIQILVATDVAARGLDINGVEHVINFDLGATKDEFDSYVHRIGRTGRAGKTGLATSFYVPGYEPKVGCGNVAKDLLHLLQESKQEVPNWFLELPEIVKLSSSSSGNGSKQKKRKGKFGGTDVRGNTNNDAISTKVSNSRKNEQDIMRQNKKEHDRQRNRNHQTKQNKSNNNNAKRQHEPNNSKRPKNNKKRTNTRNSNGNHSNQRKSSNASNTTTTRSNNTNNKNKMGNKNGGGSGAVNSRKNQKKKRDKK